MQELIDKGKLAKQASYKLANLSTNVKNAALTAIADALISEADYILSENAKDIEAGEKNGMNPGLIDRLRLTKERIEGMAEGIRQIAALPDPIGEAVSHTKRPNGLQISKIRVPLGVVGIIYESRPNVTADAAGLCIKTATRSYSAAARRRSVPTWRS